MRFKKKMEENCHILDCIEQIEESIEESYRVNLDHSLLCSNYYNLICLKNQIDVDNYVDAKKFIFHYLQYLIDEKYGYDDFNYLKIEQMLLYLNKAGRVTILEYLYREFKVNSLDIDQKWYEKVKSKYQIKAILESKISIKYLQILPLWLTVKISRLICFIIATFILLLLFLLPAPSPFMELFDITYHSYYDSFFGNHIANVLTLFFDLDNDLKISPLNFYGILLIGLVKTVYTLLFVNYLYLKVIDRFK